MSRLRSAFICLAMLIAGALWPPSPAASQPHYTGRPISIDVQDANLHHVFRIFSEVSGLNVVVDSSIQGKITMRLTDVPWDQALALVLREHGLYQVTEGRVMMIVPLKKVPHLYGASAK